MKTNEEILDKIAKLLRLAQDKGATEGEIINAMAAAKSMAMRHGLDLASVDTTEKNGKKTGDVIRDKTMKTRAKYHQPYHRYAWAVLEDVFGIKVVYNFTDTKGGKQVNYLNFIGDPLDVEISKAIYPFIEKLFPKKVTEYINARGLKWTTAIANGLYDGLYYGILEANKREEANLNAEEAQQWGLVVRDKKQKIEDATAEMFGKLTKAKATNLKYDPMARVTGRIEGKKINLRQVQ